MGARYWTGLLKWLRTDAVVQDRLDAEVLGLFTIVDSVEEALAVIQNVAVERDLVQR
jgi:hypothetical protein